MVTLFDATRPVKPSRTFGRGILRALPTYRSEVSESDRKWWAAATLAGPDARDFDAEYATRAACDRIERGVVFA